MNTLAAILGLASSFNSPIINSEIGMTKPDKTKRNKNKRRAVKASKRSNRKK